MAGTVHEEPLQSQGALTHSNLTLEVGCSYLNAAGDVVTIHSVIRGRPYPFSDQDGHVYAENGRRAAEDQAHLVCEAPKLFVPGNTYLTHGGDRVEIHKVVRNPRKGVTDPMFLLDGRSSPWRTYKAQWLFDGTYWNGPGNSSLGLQRGAIGEEATHQHLAAQEAGSATLVARIPAIPHADLIRAVLDGKVVQYKAEEDELWIDSPSADRSIVLLTTRAHAYDFRIKPEPAVRWASVSKSNDILGTIFLIPHPREMEARERAGDRSGRVLRLELDPDTLDVISAKTEAP